MDSSSGVFLECLFGFIMVWCIIVENNMGGAILCFIAIMLIDTTWDW